MTRRLILCADDYAQSAAISAGIAELIAAGRLGATSAFSQSPHWRVQARQLRLVHGRADIGLHFNLTHPFGAGQRPLSHWLLASQLRRIDRDAIRRTLLEQIDAFAEELGRLPDFIDGHQHVHALPVIRDALADAIAQRWAGDARPYLRAPDRLADTGDSRLKSTILRACCHGFADLGARTGAAVPPWFAGMYSLSEGADFRALMQRWLALCPDGGLMMCHPGQPSRDADDPIRPARAAEYRYLASDAFAEDCLAAGIEIGPYRS
ncbi:ChbG/HpnK family deacetylase [Paludibacterium yongneupense]|uniref:ChbG/HpnK family deacetylase n=1 Tax=Paludibacterium yongneupense TaxID=400061 RepID=UPI0004133D21|nr:ChbG/HpnK family deacetylase [Paludibacterium yongneupense]